MPRVALIPPSVDAERLPADADTAVAAPRTAASDSARRSLRTIALYRVVTGVILLVIALMLDLRTLHVVAPYAFLTGACLYLIFGVATFWWFRHDPFPVPLPTLLGSLLAGDVMFVILMTVASGGVGGPLPILLFPQLAASGWLLRTRVAFLHAAFATAVLLGLDVLRLLEGAIAGTQLFQMGLIGFGYFATIGIAVVLGSYAKASEALAEQRGIDVANLEQVNRLIIQDMQDGVLVVDQRGIVRSHNTQITRLLGGYGQLRGGMPLNDFSVALDGYWRKWAQDRAEPPTLKVEATQRLLRPRMVPFGAGEGGGTLVYLEDLGRAQSEAQQMKLAAMGRLTASIAHEVRNPLSAINQASQLLDEDGAVAPEGRRLLAMIRNNAKRIDHIVGEVLQLTRRDRQAQDVIVLRDFLRALVEEIQHAEKIPAGSIVVEIPGDLNVLFDPGQLNQIVWNLIRNSWQHCTRNAGSIRLTARAGYMGDAVLFEMNDDGPGIAPELHGQIFEPFFTTRSGGTGLGLYVARELADANGAALDLLPRSPGAHFRITLRRAGARHSLLPPD